MKRLSKVVLVLAFCLSCLALTACSKSDDKKLVGTWTTTIDMSKQIEAAASESEKEAVKTYFSEGMSLDFVFTFGEDKSAKMEVPEASLNALTEAYKKGMKAMFADQLGDDIDETLSVIGYASLDEFVDAMMEESMDFSSVKDQAKLNGKFEVADGKLFIYENEKNADDFIKYEFVSDTELKFTEFNLKSEASEMFELPMVLKKNK